jgi:hypothetical protein
MTEELNNFLDTLPQTPCSDPPTSRYFCTICERLNKSVQKNCKIYRSHIDQVGLGEHPYRPPADDDKIGPAQQGEESESVEFKIVGEGDEVESDSEMPLFEIVKPKIDETEPLEMSLLEDEAVEFELTKDEDLPISEDAMEVEPIEVEDEEDFTGIEVEPLEVEEITEEEPVAAPGAGPEPAAEPQPAAAAAPKKKSAKRKVKAKPKAKAVAAKRKVVKKPVAKRPVPVSATKPTPAPTPAPAASQEDLIADIEAQLIIGSPCTQCGASLNNPRFCTQCGSKVVVSANGVKTLPQ